MSILNRPDDLSDGAWEIMQVVYKNYYYNDDKTFDDFAKFSFSDEELSRYLKELHEKKYVFWINPSTDSEYLLMHTAILPYAKS